MGLDDDDVREILRIIDECDLAELRIEADGLSLYVRRGAASPPGAAPPPPSPPSPAPPPTAPATTADNDPADGRETIASPMLGTFYRAEGPGQDPFVEVGSPVTPETTVCIIEVMKMMSSVVAGIAGTIVEICPANGELVEFGAPLFRVDPSG